MTPTLALSMIVRNAESDIAPCLESARHVADEMVVADTGSTDRTPTIAREHGARVVSIPWEQDFARARNLALSHVTADWVIVLDADERLDLAPESRERLLAAGCAGFLVPIRNYVLSLSDRVWDCPALPNRGAFEEARRYPAYVDHENVRLFRRHPDIWFVGRVHESVGPRIVATDGKLAKADFLIHHFGLVASEDIRARKTHFYRELGRQKIQDMPDDGQAHFELGLVEFDNFRNYPEALRYFEQACRLSPNFSPARFFAGLTLSSLERHAEALTYFAEAEKWGHASPLIDEAKGDAYYNLGQFEQSRNSYRRALRHHPGINTLQSKLGLAQLRVGKTEAGLERLRKAAEREPAVAENLDRWITALVWLGRIGEAAAIAERKLQLPESAPQFFLRAASLRAFSNDWNRASEILRAGLEQFPDARELRLALEQRAPRKASVPARNQDSACAG